MTINGINVPVPYSINQFGSGWAVFKNGLRITPALSYDAAISKGLIESLNYLGFMLIYNPENKTTDELFKFFSEQKKPTFIFTVKLLDGSKMEFVK